MQRVALIGSSTARRYATVADLAMALAQSPAIKAKLRDYDQAVQKAAGDKLGGKLAFKK